MIPRPRSAFTGNPRARGAWKAALALLAVTGAFLSHGSVEASYTYSVGAAETIYTAAHRRSLGLPFWTDGSLGVVAAGNGQYEFYGADAGASVRTTGTL